MPLKIFFGGSLFGGRDDAPLYSRIIEHLRKHGEVLSEHGRTDEEIEEVVQSSPKYIHDGCLALIAQSDVAVFEVTQPSLGVGYETAKAAASSIPVLALFRPSSGKRLSAMIDGAHNGSSFIVQRYNEEEFAAKIDEFFTNFKK